MIKINAQLKRPDGGKVSSGSIVEYDLRFVPEELTICYKLTHWFSQSAKDSRKLPIKDGVDLRKLPIQSVKDFSYKINRICTEEEWDSLNDAGSPDMIEGWLKILIEEKIGVGDTEII